MTSGSAVPNPGASGEPGAHDGAYHDDPAAPRTERLGPLPPRMNPLAPGQTSQHRTVGLPPGQGQFQHPHQQPHPGQGPAGAVPTGPASPPRPGPMPATGPMPQAGPPGGMPPAVQQVPAAAMPPAGPVGQRPPGYPATGGFPAVPNPLSGPPAPVSAAAGGGPAGHRRQWLGGIALTFTLLLMVVVAVQAVAILGLSRQVDRAEDARVRADASASAQLGRLDSRVAQLEGGTFNSEEVAATVTPSVFKVVADDASGTAFAVGKAPAGGTDLVTNFHVVADLYRKGGRGVSLERDNKRFNATITRVDEVRDLAIVHANEKFPRLTAADVAAKPGEPILVVGAPLGLESTITTGVVSALRDTPDGPRVQIDAAINPGNSGGPVINARKQVVGVAVAKISSAENVGLAIPVAVVCESLGIC